MSAEQKNRFVSQCRGLLDIDAPADVVRCKKIPVEIRLLARAALGSLTGSERDRLLLWIEEEARHGSWQRKSIPPFSIFRCTDLLDKLWGWDRLLAYDVGDVDVYWIDDRAIYESYLEKFYASNPHNDEADAILKCLEKEKVLTTDWKTRRTIVLKTLSERIQKCMSNLLNDAGSESRQAFSTCAAVCIMKEAELMIEWLSKGSPVSWEEYNTCNKIRQCALQLAMFEGKWNAHAAAVLLGITKEAVFLLERARSGDLVPTDISKRIRTNGLDYLISKFVDMDAYESDTEFTPGVSDEMSSAAEINQLARGNTESVSFGKNELLERIIDVQNITEEEYKELYLRRPSAVDDEVQQSRSNAEA